jgi:hypothetical protein
MNINFKEEVITRRTVTIELTSSEAFRLAKLLYDEVSFAEAEKTHGLPAGTLTNLYAALMGQQV